MVVIKNEHGLLGRGTLESAVSQDLHTHTNLGKLKVTVIIIGWAWSKMGKAL